MRKGGGISFRVIRAFRGWYPVLLCCLLLLHSLRGVVVAAVFFCKTRTMNRELQLHNDVVFPGVHASACEPCRTRMINRELQLNNPIPGETIGRLLSVVAKPPRPAPKEYTDGGGG